MNKIMQEYHQLIIGVLVGLVVGFLFMHQPVEKNFVSHSYFKAFTEGTAFMGREMVRKEEPHVNRK